LTGKGSFVKHRILRALMPLGLYPHINFTYSPFKILEYEAMLRWLPPAGGGTALDIGCGDGLHTMLLGRRFAKTCGVDVNERFIAIARGHARHFGRRANLEFFSEPVERIGFAPDTFDVVLSVCVLEHIPNHEDVLRECLRIMKPGARIVFSVDTLETITDPRLIESHRAQHHVVRYFRRDTLAELLTRTGFVNLEFQPLFRSDLARRLFTEGIEHGFNFGRLRAPRLAAQLRRAERALPADAPGTFLLARGERPR
jgi:2-polyprenyl-3-methyl-5-hydroxy-6-metoxy-1,4-benzoquinol methylase